MSVLESIEPIEQSKKRLQECGTGLTSLKKEAEGFALRISKINTELASMRGQCDQLLAQAGVSSPEELHNKRVQAIDECEKEYHRFKEIVDSVRKALTELEQKRAELDAAEDALQK